MIRRQGAWRAALLAAGTALCPCPTWAQVTVNPGALDLLPTPQQARPAPRQAAPPRRPANDRRAHPARPVPDAQTSPQPAQPGTVQGAPVSVPPPSPATSPANVRPNMPTVPPAIAALPPPAPVPPPRPLPPAVATVTADAPGASSPLTGGLRITFGPDRQDLNPATEAALRDLARAQKAGDQAINLYAYAPGAPDDPSTPRRLALGRALAARAVLIQEGIASTRIYPRALIAQPDDKTPDRVDAVAGAVGPPATIVPPAPGSAK